MADTEGWHGVRGAAALGLVLAAGVVGAGLLKYSLTAAGFARLGTLAWIAGYAATVLVVWYVWIRPLDLTGSAG